ncbi:MAG TPA: hypothetical protein VGH99_08160 [Pseudonocardia sp.]
MIIPLLPRMGALALAGVLAGVLGGVLGMALADEPRRVNVAPLPPVRRP